MKQEHTILLLSGTPASGKDTITRLLPALDSRFKHFRKHRSDQQAKAGDTYRHVTPDEFSAMVNNNEFLQYHYRYGRGYGVAYQDLRQHWNKGEIPVIHVGKYENIAAFQQMDSATISILLMVALEATRQRLAQRHPNNPQEVSRRLAAYDEERHELATLIRSGQRLNFDFIVDNSGDQPEETARLIAGLCQERLRQ